MFLILGPHLFQRLLAGSIGRKSSSQSPTVPKASSPAYPSSPRGPSWCSTSASRGATGPLAASWPPRPDRLPTPRTPSATPSFWTSKPPKAAAEDFDLSRDLRGGGPTGHSSSSSNMGLWVTAGSWRGIRPSATGPEGSLWRKNNHDCSMCKEKIDKGTARNYLLGSEKGKLRWTGMRWRSRWFNE